MPSHCLYQRLSLIHIFGVMKDVLQTGANDVYVIEGNDGKEYLFPAIKQCILKVDLEAGEMTVHIMDGLLDL